ncbi:MAG TPA: RING finger protein [Planctomycetota bacterium]|nr:RING finger protein [Planctomycetota bacterium]
MGVFGFSWEQWFLTLWWLAGILLSVFFALRWNVRLPGSVFSTVPSRAREVIHILARNGAEGPDGLRLAVRGREAILVPKGGVFVLRVPASPSAEQLDAIRRVLRTRGLKDFHLEEGWVVARTPSLAAGIGVRSEAERLLTIVERIVALTPAFEEALSVKPLEIERRRCPYCHDELTRGETHAFCTKCGSAHHVECYADHGRCAIFGCGGSGQRAAASPTRAHSRASLSAATLIGSSSPEARIAR